MIKADFQALFRFPVELHGKLAVVTDLSLDRAQKQTNAAFSEKWARLDEAGSGSIEIFQKQWLLDLYGFKSEQALKIFLSDKKVIVDAGCGLGYKSAWLAELAPASVVFGVDFCESAKIAAKRYGEIPNLFFVRGDIADLPFRPGVVDFILCDQVIHHTQNPRQTFAHLSSLLSPDGRFACYVYAKKALPRELIDDYFRQATLDLSHEDLWAFSGQMTQLGKALSDLNLTFVAPEIPVLGIRGGEYDIQRFIYWNFLKCFYRPDWSKAENDACNFDWYAPSNAARYTPEEIRGWVTELRMRIFFFHSEEACHTLIVGP
jgi:SAM-dependent methyltransferase